MRLWEPGRAAQEGKASQQQHAIGEMGACTEPYSQSQSDKLHPQLCDDSLAYLSGAAFTCFSGTWQQLATQHILL